MGDGNQTPADYAFRISMNFNCLVYYNIHGLILAGVPAKDISINMRPMYDPHHKTIISIKGVPAISISVRSELDEGKISFYFDEVPHCGIVPPLLHIFMEGRKSQPTAI